MIPLPEPQPVPVGAKIVYRYSFTFARMIDADRPDWPLEMLTTLSKLRGVVDWVVIEAGAAWRRTGGEGLPRHESYVPMLEVTVASVTPAEAEDTRKALVAFVSGLGMGAARMTRWGVEVQTL